MQTYERILCAVDFSAISNSASARAVALALQFGARLTFLHVIEYFPENLSNVIIGPESIDPAEYNKAEVHKNLTELAERLGFKEARCEVSFSPHAAWHEIVHFAGQENVDLIVLGCHGHHGVATLLGSTSNGVVNRAPCDVLTVRPHL
jgi:universal stress protein A